ncbi:two-component system regulatory protein YycI [Aerococcus urinaeequi]|uniref:two-component system regulatory protein YycI n=1 Tax=Aerococcus urinaeequi TaxID=51665 RepID=UPI000845DF92|nr:two-component system regulatory protein YycI [Aerococcus urinaeequi]
MNFKKVEVIFILAFLILDVFLINIFMNKYVGASNQAIENQSLDIVTEFKANNIQYDEISDEVLRIPFIRSLNTTLSEEDVLAVTEDTQSVEVNGNQILGQINTPIQLEGVTGETPAGELSDSALASLNQFINSEIYQGNQYRFISYDKNAGRVTYMQETASGAVIADGTGEIVFKVNDDFAVYAYDQTIAGGTATQGEERTVISEQQALENAYLNNSIPDESTIVRSFLSYRVTLVLDEMTLYHPVWTLLIHTNEGTTQRVFVDGINGAIMTQ